jgi:hypothetical protein
MAKRTTVEVSLETWQRLNERKNRPGESFDEVIAELLDSAESVDDDPNGRVTPKNTPTDDTTPASTSDEAPRDDAPASSSSADVDVLDAMDIPQGKDPEACRDALYAVRDYLEEHGPASRREIVTAVMPDHPLGYDVPDLETGDRFRGAWWRRIIQPGLRTLDDVEYRENHSDYRVP